MTSLFKHTLCFVLYAAMLYGTAANQKTVSVFNESALLVCGNDNTDDLPQWSINGVIYHASSLPPGHFATSEGLRIETTVAQGVYECHYLLQDNLTSGIVQFLQVTWPVTYNVTVMGNYNGR